LPEEHKYFVQFPETGFISSLLFLQEAQIMPVKAGTANISIILFRPKHAGNVGAIARAAKNMGISQIIVVGAQGLDREEMEQRSTHLARDVVDNIKYADSAPEALCDFQYIIGTTARTGRARGPFVTPRAAARKAAELAPANRVALLFGPEDTGLANEQLHLCHCVVTIPTSREFTSVNLSHAVMILCYEIFLATQASDRKVAGPGLALSSELEGMYGQISSFLAQVGFVNRQNPEYWMLDLRRFFTRAGLSSREVKIFRGICSQIEWYANKNNK